MELNIFKEKIQILENAEQQILRNKYLECFIDTNSDSYREQIIETHRFLDGVCYLGYLWDYVKNPIIIPEEFIYEMSKRKKYVYVFWDIHSCERIFIKDYWKFKKDAMLKLPLNLLLMNEKYLPEDIYIFDETLTWTLIKTHEDINGHRYCIKSGNI